MAVGYAVDAARLRRQTGEPLPVDELLLWLWVVVILGFFSMARFKLDWYIFPAAPACCILAARGWRRLADTPGRWTRVAVTLAGVAFLCGGVISAVAIFQIDLGVSRAGVVVPVVLTCGGSILLWQLLHAGFRQSPSVAIPVGTLLAAYVTGVVVGFPVLERSRPTASIGRWVQRHTAPGAIVGVYGLDDWRSSIRDYTDRQVQPLGKAEAVREFLSRTPNGYVLMLRGDYEAMRGTSSEIVEMTGRPAIVGRSGKYLRHQIWGRLVIVSRRDNDDALAKSDLADEPGDNDDNEPAGRGH